MGNLFRYILPGTTKVYEEYMKRTKQLPQSVDLGHGSHGHWVGDKDADNVLIWYHGASIQHTQKKEAGREDSNGI